MRRLLSLLLPIALAISGVSVLAEATVGQLVDTPAEAASSSDFDAGYIISDANFYDSDALTADQIQSFLNSQVPTCDTNHAGTTYKNVYYSGPWTCLKDYTVTISDNPSTANCSSISGGTYSSAQLIDKVARACGISQKVLLVLLQKEQALVTDTWPGPWQYQKATGYACPDTAACDSTYYGFFNQLYMAAWQFKQYQATASSRAYKAGAWNAILYSPTTSCGTKSVYIQNQATASLYLYTPYTPNQAALDNLYGSGDSCSSYGNRNFWRLYSDWFGSPTEYQVLGDMGARWAAIGGASSVLGSPVAAEVCNWSSSNTNCYQNFEGGAISWTPSTGAWETYGDIRARWGQLGYENGTLGYPTSAPVNTSGHAYQTFQGGSIGWSSSRGAFAVTGDINPRWLALGAATGVLGAPIEDEVCNSAGTSCYQNFEGGAISWTPSTGAWETYGDIRARWGQLGYENGTLGYPTSAVTCTLKDNGCYQNFQNGAITTTAAAGTWETYGDIRARWGQLGYENGTLGYPTSAVTCAASLCSQNFQGGVLTSGS